MSQYYYNPFGENRDTYEENRLQFELMQMKKQQKKELRRVSIAIGIAIMGYLVVQTFATYLLELFGLTDFYFSNSVFQYAFNIIAISFFSVAVPFGLVALCNKKKYTSPIVPDNSIKLSKCTAWVCFGMACCILANYFTSFVCIFFENILKLKLTQTEMTNPNSVFACILNIIGISIIPAICEEFAMRCCALQLLKKYGKGFAVFAVSIVFGLLHGNVIQFLFAFLVGLALGLMTIKTNSIVPAILVHAFNNGISAVQSVVTYSAGKDLAEKAVIVIYILWLAFGAIATLYLLFTNEFKRENKHTNLLTTGERFKAFLFPGMVVPFIILIALTALTVKPV